MESSYAGREGVDVVVCVDSGYYGGKLQVLRTWKMKKALKLVIQKLNPKDRLSIIARRNDELDRLCPLRCMTPTAQADLEALIGSLTNCDINIRKSYEMALSIIRGRVHTGDRTACMFYVTNHYEKAGHAGSVDLGNVTVHTYGFAKRPGQNHQLLKNLGNKSLAISSLMVESDLSEAFSQLLGGDVRDDVGKRINTTGMQKRSSYAC
ncbi:unnamed protein product [Urochloa humidicola]